MYCYNSLLLIINILILTKQIQSQKAKGPGISGCVYSGTIQEECGVPSVPIKNIPPECTSIVFYGLYVDLRYHVLADPCACEENSKLLALLDEILKSGKSTYVYFGHNTQAEWTHVLACEDSNGGTNSLDEMKGLKAFFDEHPGITGIILLSLDNDPVYSKPFPKYSENLKKYLEVMRQTFPKLEIGIEFLGAILINQIITPQIPWLDFNIIDPFLDFYIISTICFNDCKPELINTGLTPISSPNTNYTLENLKNALQKAHIPQTKTYFALRLNPNSGPDDSLTRCNLTIQQICNDKNGTSTWCADDQASFFEKGKFVKENGVGFITSSIDFNDPTNICKCEKGFASFYAILDGFNGVTPKPCALFKRG